MVTGSVQGSPTIQFRFMPFPGLVIYTTFGQRVALGVKDFVTVGVHVLVLVGVNVWVEVGVHVHVLIGVGGIGLDVVAIGGTLGVVFIAIFVLFVAIATCRSFIATVT